ncbi:protein bud22 [Cladorrhinum sp. PSN332]|nr:protein bud22 [Cladorrhinum sp. PSN332]
MPKRKRNDEESVQSIFTRLRLDVFHALKHAKGFERQRQSKRLRDPKATPDKKARLEKEIVVLKSLDLQQTAHAHLCSSLLRIKGIAESDKVPEEIKAGVPKPELTEEEKAALHNVTSALYNQQGVRTVIDQAIAAVCGAIGVPVPEKKGKGKRKQEELKEEVKQEEAKEVKSKAKKEKAKKDEEEPVKNKPKEKIEEKIKEKTKETKPNPESERELDLDLDDEELEKAVEELQDLLGSDSESGSSSSADQEEYQTAEEEAEPEIDDDDLEKTVSKMEGLLGSDSEGSDSEQHKLLTKTRTQPKKPLPKDLDPMEITDDEEADADSESNSDDEDDELDPMEITDDEASAEEEDELDIDLEEEASEASSEAEFEGFSDADSANQNKLEDDSENDSEDDSEDDSEASDSSASVSSIDRPPPAKRSKPIKQDGNSLFLPTLMGGYISGSDSEASDLDLAPPRKNRRGQRARQQIWEKKFKEKAKHLAKQQARDSGWDLKRGAVENDGKPWKKGIKNPLLKRAASGANDIKVVPKQEEQKKVQRTRDDAGSLHPSWEARRLAKEKERLTAPFEGKKITFD